MKRGTREPCSGELRHQDLEERPRQEDRPNCFSAHPRAGIIVEEAAVRMLRSVGDAREQFLHLGKDREDRVIILEDEGPDVEHMTAGAHGTMQTAEPVAALEGVTSAPSLRASSAAERTR